MGAFLRHSQYEFDFGSAVPAPLPSRGPVPGARPLQARQRRGQTAYLAGRAAEDNVERYLVARGLTLMARRWRCKSGEIDLVFREGARVIFVEVKAGPSHEAAAARISHKQADRIARSAQCYVDEFADGSLTDMRLDVALVDGTGRVSVLENAFAGWW